MLSQNEEQMKQQRDLTEYHKLEQKKLRLHKDAWTSHQCSLLPGYGCHMNGRFRRIAGVDGPSEATTTCAGHCWIETSCVRLTARTRSRSRLRSRGYMGHLKERDKTIVELMPLVRTWITWHAGRTHPGQSRRSTRR